jgi:hypothetical protein
MKMEAKQNKGRGVCPADFGLDQNNWGGLFEVLMVRARKTAAARGYKISHNYKGKPKFTAIPGSPTVGPVLI